MKLGKSIPPRTEKLISQSAENPDKKPRRELRKEFRSPEASLLIKKDQQHAIMSLGNSTSIRRLKVICLIETLANLSFTKI